MPTYEYRCGRCGVVEIVHAISEPAREHCPVCGRVVKRLVSGGVGFVMEPNGFWEMGRDGRERKVARSEREREWRSIAGREKPIV
jgi:putative FmdB family regulatory protein